MSNLQETACEWLAIHAMIFTPMKDEEEIKRDIEAVLARLEKK